MADLHIVPYKQFISGQAELFVAKAGKDQGEQPQLPFINNGRYIKADGKWPFYQSLRTRIISTEPSWRPAHDGQFIKASSNRKGRPLHLALGGLIRYCAA